MLLFAGVQQLLVITGLHHIIGAAEAQLLADTKHNFHQPIDVSCFDWTIWCSIGYLITHWKDTKARELLFAKFCFNIVWY